MKQTGKKQWLLAVACMVILFMWILYGNSKLVITDYQVSSDRIPESFDGFRIVQISDLHNARFGKENEKLLERLSHAEPDVIVLTGDLVDSRRTDLDIALSFAARAVQIAPVYYVPGNHEARIPEYEQLKSDLTEARVTVLENQKVRLDRDGMYITLMGIPDPSFYTDYLLGDSRAVAAQAIKNLQNKTDGYTVLLSHRPELFDIYVAEEVDLVFSGHAHGGQFRIPFIGGLVAPNQGFFPKYDAGQFQRENTTMIVSRGVGNSILPVRINNPPELVVVELNRQG